MLYALPVFAGRLFFEIGKSGFYPHQPYYPTLNLSFASANLSLTAGAVLPPISADMLERSTPDRQARQMRGVTIPCQRSETEYVAADGCGERAT